MPPEPDVKRTIMVVDDDPDIVEMTRMVLEQDGYLVHPARSGPEALSCIEQARPDLVLLDINMPEMDGWQVLRALKIDARTTAIPVAMFSIKMQVRDKLLGAREGACGFITKPFSCDELLIGVRRILDTLDRRTAGA